MIRKFKTKSSLNIEHFKESFEIGCSFELDRPSAVPKIKNLDKKKKKRLYTSSFLLSPKRSVTPLSHAVIRVTQPVI